MNSLKNISQIEYSRQRSIHGFIINVFLATGPITFCPGNLPKASHFETDNTESLQLIKQIRLFIFKIERPRPGKLHWFVMKQS